MERVGRPPTQEPRPNRSDQGKNPITKEGNTSRYSPLLLVLTPYSILTKGILKGEQTPLHFYYLKPAAFLDIPSLQLTM